MKFYIANKYGVYSAQSFTSFESAWDFADAHIPFELHYEIYVLSENEAL